MAVRILVVEDDPPTRERLARVMGAAPEIVLVGQAGDVASGRALLGACDVLLTDLGLPDGSGMTLIKEGLALNPELLPMVITVFGDERHVVDALEAGALGYVLKDGSDAQLIASVQELLAGGSPISPSIARHILKRFKPVPAAAAPAPAKDAAPAPTTGRSMLSERENEVLIYISKGLTYKEIADLMTLSAHTVTTHVRHIYRKLAVGSRAEAVFEAVQLGLIDLGE